MFARLLNVPAVLLAAIASVLAGGCGTFVSPAAERLPEAERVTLQCYWRFYGVYIGACHVSSVDGRRTGVLDAANITTKLAPGHIWVEFSMESYFGGGGGVTDVCAFEHDFLAGHRYRIVAHTIKRDVGWLRRFEIPLYTASIDLEATSPRGAIVIHRPALTCASSGSLCRTTADCEPHPNIVCTPVPGHAYGICGSRN